jgi:hypothetical protein
MGMRSLFRRAIVGGWAGWLGIVSLTGGLVAEEVRNTAAIEIGGRLEPLVDDFLFERIEGEVKWELHRPERHAQPLTLDRPWEGNNSNYGTILNHEGTYYFYYRGTALELGEKRIGGVHFATTCVMTSKDGIHWERPDLGFVKKPGWEKNNIILTFDPECKINFSKGESLDDGNDLLSGKKVPFTGAVHNFTPMIDTNPDCSPEQKFKAVGGHDHRLLYAFVSPDGLNWSMLRKEPIITDGMLDSQNLSFWDPVQQCYYAYYRDFKNKAGDTERRDSRKDYSLMDRDVEVRDFERFFDLDEGGIHRMATGAGDAVVHQPDPVVSGGGAFADRVSDALCHRAGVVFAVQRATGEVGSVLCVAVYGHGIRFEP